MGFKWDSVIFGLPAFIFPCGVQKKATLRILSVDILRPTYPVMCVITGNFSDMALGARYQSNLGLQHKINSNCTN
ncbi:hypothetical protein BpHYR1_018785 [Brachionus plicatilis]|uniref:Uncharacterized protein n=1 Tax=Brachionus plicatilis TaxID=10195 RepID=A0A3M7SJ61_BRAPC|nr:hypothetical protein BpHYR1_018785 [Brachionus plicatilis]